MKIKRSYRLRGYEVARVAASTLDDMSGRGFFSATEDDLWEKQEAAVKAAREFASALMAKAYEEKKAKKKRN